MFSEEEQPDHRYTDLELLEEKLDIAAFRVEKYQQALQKYHSQRVRGGRLVSETWYSNETNAQRIRPS